MRYAAILISIVLINIYCDIALSQEFLDQDYFSNYALKLEDSMSKLTQARGGRYTSTGSTITIDRIARMLKPRTRVKGEWDGSVGYWPNTAVLVYHFEAGKLRSWLIGSDGLLANSAVETGLATIDRRIQDQRTALDVEKLQAGRTEGLRRTSRIRLQDAHAAPKLTIEEATRELARLLLPPPIVTGLRGVEHLIVVPIHRLGVVPFALFKPFDNDSYLIDRMSITIAPSLVDLVAAKTGSGFICPSPRVPIVERKWAGIDLTSPLIVGLSEFPHGGGHRFQPLPGSQQEVEAVSKELNAVPLINAKATIKNVAKSIERSSIIYMATHGFADHEEGYLVLWPDDSSNGILSGQRIHDFKLRGCHVVILSACQTGLGRVHDAGMIGVARSFQMGGAPRVVVSLWSVYDKETAIFMVKFIKKMRETMVAEALRLTAIEMRNEYPDPVVWASFSLFGTPR